MTRALVAPLACVVCITAACSAPLMKLPTGTGVPAADAAEMFNTAGIAAVMNQYNGGDPATTE